MMGRRGSKVKDRPQAESRENGLRKNLNLAVGVFPQNIFLITMSGFDSHALPPKYLINTNS
jgi:hypothetical protein